MEGKVTKIASLKKKKSGGVGDQREMGGNCVGSDRQGNDSGEKEGRGDEIGGAVPCRLGFALIPSSAH